MRYSMIITDGYISALTTGDCGIEISEAYHAEILDAVSRRPSTPFGYELKLKPDLTWDILEQLPGPYVEEYASAEDYETALGRFGV